MKYKISWSKSGHNEIHSEILNCDDGFSEDYFVYTTKEDRDFHYKENIKE